VIKGDSSSGKSFGVECALEPVAPEELYKRTKTSPLALFYSEEDFRHRTIVFFEANSLTDDDDPLGDVLRTLISEGKLAYEVTDPRSHSTKYLEKDGPVAFLTTTCAPSLGKEIETRILSLHSDSSDAQTAAVVESILLGATGAPGRPDLGPWHELDRWLRDGLHEVDLPWAPALATFGLTGPTRLRRDISNLLALARAHALLHRATRELDPRGRIVSTIDDYAVVRQILSDSLAVATDRAVRPGTREIVEAVAALKANGADRISLSAASRAAGRSKSTTNTDVHDALERGYLIDHSPTSSQAFNLDVGDPLPEQDDLLPNAEDLAAAFALRSPTVRSGTERFKPASEAGLRKTVRSVRSNPELEAFDRLLEEKRREG
jgi:hypothetical protein